MRPLIYDLSLADLQNTLTAWGEPRYRARQVWEGLYCQLWSAPEQFTNLPRRLRDRLAGYFRFQSLTPLQVLDSDDGETQKTLFRLPDGAAIETVRMRYRRRRTLCISTQAGCGMGCTFCATGQMGFRRNLSAGEIVEQVLHYARQLRAAGQRVTNVVVMGMGEPFHNYDATMQALDRLSDPQGFRLGARRITVSTVGLVPAIRRFTRERRQINLAVSLHAADDDLRSRLLPINRRYPLAELFAAVRDYVQATHRRVTFEWALIRGVNDDVSHARALAQRCRGLLCHVNVIPLNPTAGYAGQATTRERAAAFQAELERHGIPCTIRVRRGVDIQAGCGQLASREASERSPA